MEASPQGGGDEQPEGHAAGEGADEGASQPHRTHQRCSQKDARHPPHHHPDPHLHIDKALILRHEGPGEGGQAVGDGQSRDREEAGVAAERPGHGGGVAAGAHGGAQPGAEEEIEQQHSQRGQQQHAAQPGRFSGVCFRKPQSPRQRQQERFAPVEQRGHAGERNIAAAEHHQIDARQRRCEQNP